MPARRPEANTEPTTHERILAAAAALFVARGYASVSMREISQQLHLSKAALYHHFRDKQALLLEVLLAGIGQAGSIVTQAAGCSGGTRARLSALLTGIARNRHAQLTAMRLAERDAVHLTDEARVKMHGAYRTSFVRPIEEILRNGQATGELRAEVDPTWLTRTLLILAQPLLSVQETEIEGAVAATITLFFEGAGTARS